MGMLLGEISWSGAGVAGINERRFWEEDVRYGGMVLKWMMRYFVQVGALVSIRKDTNIEMCLFVLCQFWKRSRGTTTFVQNFHKASS